jgi:magnesium-transporting ATPase (P-type)
VAGAALRVKALRAPTPALGDGTKENAMQGAVLSIVMLAGIALLAGAWFLWKRTGQMKQPLLMVVLALIAFLNVAIWTVPAPDGTAPIERTAD